MQSRPGISKYRRVVCNPAERDDGASCVVIDKAKCRVHSCETAGRSRGECLNFMTDQKLDLGPFVSYFLLAMSLLTGSAFSYHLLLFDEPDSEYVTAREGSFVATGFLGRRCQVKVLPQGTWPVRDPLGINDFIAIGAALRAAMFEKIARHRLSWRSSCISEGQARRRHGHRAHLRRRRNRVPTARSSASLL